MARAAVPPPGPAVADSDRALQQSVGRSTRDERAVVGRRCRARTSHAFADPAGIFVVDDTTLPKQGKQSVGIQRRYCGALGE
jgi:SRSO17 transposase